MEIESKISNLCFDKSRFVKCKIDVCHDKLNHNNTWFDADVLEKCAKKSLFCIPILANVYKDGDEYKVGSHDMDFNLLETKDGYNVDVFYLEKPCGFVPPDAEIEMVYNAEDDKTHLVTTGVIWKNYASQLLNYMEQRDGELAVSMEINCKSTRVHPNNGSTIIDDFAFEGITILGDEHPPAMEGANIKTFSMKDIKVELQEMIKAYSKGGENVEENKVETEEFAELNVVKEEVETVTIDGEVVEEVKETTEIKEIIPDEPVDEPMPCDYAEEVEDVAEEFADDKEDEEDKEEPEDEEKDEEEKPDEYAILKEEYEALKVSYAQLEERLNAMSDYEELKAFKENADRVAYEKEVEEVAHMFNLDADEVNELKVQALAKEISIEQFKEKLGYKFAMKQIAKKPSKVVESSEMEIVDNTINSDAPYCGRFEKYRNKK